jgi:hypothetical protein
MGKWEIMNTLTQIIHCSIPTIIKEHQVYTNDVTILCGTSKNNL